MTHGDILACYAGKRREALLLLVACGLLWSLWGILLAVDVLGSYGVFVPRHMPATERVLAGTFLIIMSILAYLAGQWLARKRGTSVMVFSDHIEVKEWYGGRRSFNLTPGVVVQTSRVIKVLGLFEVTLKDLRMIQIGRYTAYLNLDDYPDPRSEMSSLASLLRSLREKSSAPE